MLHSKTNQSFGVIGLGRFGMTLAAKLAESGKECIGEQIGTSILVTMHLINCFLSSTFP